MPYLYVLFSIFIWNTYLDTEACHDDIQIQIQYSGTIIAIDIFSSYERRNSCYKLFWFCAFCAFCIEARPWNDTIPGGNPPRNWYSLPWAAEVPDAKRHCCQVGDCSIDLRVRTVTKLFKVKFKLVRTNGEKCNYVSNWIAQFLLKNNFDLIILEWSKENHKKVNI